MGVGAVETGLEVGFVTRRKDGPKAPLFQVHGGKNPLA